MQQADLNQWCKRELCRSFGFDIDDDIISYLLSIETESSIEDYVNGIFLELGDKKQSKSFVREYLVRWKSLRNDEMIAVPLKRLKNEQLVLFDKKQSKPHGKKIKTGTTKAPPPGLEETTIKSKYVPLLSTRGQDKLIVNIPGRHFCQCLGQKHDLVNNCLDCGRIICSQEGPGPCLYCGTIVFTREEEQILARDSKRADKLKEKMRQQYDRKGEAPHSIGRNQSNNDLMKANEHKDKLIQFDKTSQRRTKVVDDESDYFRVDNQWLTDQEKTVVQTREESLRDTKYGSRSSKGIKVSLDIAGRQVTEQNDKDIDLYNDEEQEELIAKQLRGNSYELAQRGIYDHSISLPPPLYYGKKGHQNNKKKVTLPNVEQVIRIQDKYILEMRDEGKCLSMHQPWASLLIYGIKKFEGRSWYSPHRGKLWIASTAKTVEQDDVTKMEQFYKRDERGDIVFPDSYPNGCLLGCVDVVECLSQEECAEKYENCESESDYVFVCENPQVLVIKFPIKGKHKIWKLGVDIHAAAKKSCQILTHMI